MFRKLMPLGLLFVLVSFALTGAGQGPSSKSKHGKPKIDPALAAAAKPLVTTGCDDSLSQHVYNPQRLQVVEKCIAVTGTIHHVKKEPGWRRTHTTDSRLRLLRSSTTRTTACKRAAWSLSRFAKTQ